MGKLPIEHANPPLEPEEGSSLPILRTGTPAWLCHTYDGRPFWCDTDFKLREWVNFGNLLDDTWEKHICLTGGEPLIHKDKIETFLQEAEERDIKIHIETSGTIEFQEFQNYNSWISVSPKQGALDIMIELADEIKLLVDEHFDLASVPDIIRDQPCVYVQPINDELMVSRANFDLCMKILRIMPEWHCSFQAHKLLGLR